MSKNLTLAEKKATARKKLSKLQAIYDKTGVLSQKQSQEEYEQLLMLAEANIKSMTVTQAEEWAKDFIQMKPGEEPNNWAWRIVGQVDVHASNPRGPKTQKDSQIEVSEIYLRIIKIALKLEKLPSERLTKQNLDLLEARVQSICQGQFIAPPSRVSISTAIKSISKNMGR
jgi:hypothetical protein